MDQSRVLEALRQVIDPEVGVNIVDLGLVHLLDVNDRRIYIGLIMTTPACPQSGVLCDQAHTAVGAVAEGRDVDVELLDHPLWSPDRLSPAARAQLGWTG